MCNVLSPVDISSYKSPIELNLCFIVILAFKESCFVYVGLVNTVINNEARIGLVLSQNSLWHIFFPFDRTQQPGSVHRPYNGVINLWPTCFV